MALSGHAGARPQLPSATPSPSRFRYSWIRVPVSTIYEWRAKGRAPLAHHYGEHLTFASSDVKEWVDAQREPEPLPPTQRR